MVSKLALMCFQNRIEYSTADSVKGRLNEIFAAVGKLSGHISFGIFGIIKVALFFLNFTNSASCIDFTISDSAVNAFIVFVKKRRSRGFVGSFPWKTELGQLSNDD